MAETKESKKENRFITDNDSTTTLSASECSEQGIAQSVSFSSVVGTCKGDDNLLEESKDEKRKRLFPRKIMRKFVPSFKSFRRRKRHCEDEDTMSRIGALSPEVKANLLRLREKNRNTSKKESKSNELKHDLDDDTSISEIKFNELKRYAIEYDPNIRLDEDDESSSIFRCYNDTPDDATETSCSSSTRSTSTNSGNTHQHRSEGKALYSPGLSSFDDDFSNLSTSPHVSTSPTMIRLSQSDVPKDYPVSLINKSAVEKKEDTRGLKKSNSRFSPQFYMSDLPKKHRVTKNKKGLYEKKNSAHPLTKANSRFHPRLSKTELEKEQDTPARKKRKNVRLNERIRSFGTTLFGGLEEEEETVQTSIFDELEGKELDKAFDDALGRAFDQESIPDFSLFNPTLDEDDDEEEYTDEHYSRAGSVSTISNVSEHYCRGFTSVTFCRGTRGTSKTSKKKKNKEEDDSFISALSSVVDDCCFDFLDDCTRDVKKDTKKKNVDFFHTDDHSEDPLEGYSIGYESSTIGSSRQEAEISLLS
eukprot:CAMPEP_0198287528 /NCGR_PEP_ID=MMETSP1449-20131203/6301_1 /TAXON_ID=420275 /ORGANISM="Attheya septentrionalis, Strain CCMP2084" /LENGTH=531 /DNA_ID=CAMNT_0043985489 /DNA_START=217 /DNA_END=1812 /DNA_ORIENTATION=+